MGRCLVALALCGACSARLGPFTSDNTQVDAGRDGNGGGSDAPTMLGPWSTPTPITGANSTINNEDDETLSSTALELIYAVATPTANKDLYVMTRASTTDAFGAPAPLTGLNTTGTEESPRLSVDDKTLYFGRDGDIYMTMRATAASAWGPATIVTGSGDTASYEKWLAVCGTNHFMVSRDNGVTGQDLFEGTLGTAGTIVTELNSAKSEISTFLSPDCLTVMFASNRVTQSAIYMSTRPSMAAPWSTPVAMPAPFDAGTDNEDPWISTDQRIFVFASIRNGATTKDLYISTR